MHARASQPLSPLAALAGWSGPESPFHSGERAIQARLGVEGKIDRDGRRVIRPYLTEQHRSFFPLLPFVLVGAVDAVGQPWATILAGPSGFMQSPDPRHLTIDAAPLLGDPLLGALEPGADIGLLGIELPTRRRNRLNGHIEAVSTSALTVAVDQSFGNCPQYIQTRDSWLATGPYQAPGVVADQDTQLQAVDQALIAAADTFFIATANEQADAGAAKGADVSHRGGKPGFVRIDDAVTLTTPDFVGNFLFNTLGNIALDPRAGLLFIDWARGDLLHLAGEAEVIWDGAEVRAFAGAERLLRFHIRLVVRRPGALPLRFAPPGFSPLLDRTGDWEAAAGALAAERLRNTWRPYRVVATAEESSVVRSFILEPADGGGVAPHAPGQHLPIRLTLPGQSDPVQRAYTISDAPNGRSYRISVKREGAVSGWLHTTARLGTTVETLAPRGAFVFDAESRRSAVLISAGIGITPTIAMLNSLLVNEGRTRHHAPITVIHGARDGSQHAFAGHLHALAAKHGNLSVHVCYSQPVPGDVMGRDYDSAGRVDMALLKRVLPFDDHDFYLCGPAGFMQSLYDGLRALGISDERIRFEAFGPASVRRTRTASPAPAIPSADDEALAVTFARSGRRALWRPDRGTLLDLAEAEGLTPAFGCRAGTCGTCATRLVAGAVDYAEPPAYPVAPDDALICCATPHPGPHLGDTLDREGVTLDL